MGLNKLNNLIREVESGLFGPCFVAEDPGEGTTAHFGKKKPELQGR
jgi:hypothetical protein